MINCKHIELSYPDNTIFTDLSLYIPRGESVCVCGPSGVGKSTLLRMIQGFVVPQKGEIIVNGLELNKLHVEAIREQIVWVPQNINLPVSNAVELLQLMNISGKIDQVIKNTEGLGLSSEIISKGFSKLSGGQKQRLLIAIGLSLQKDLLIMDEPTSSLDEDSIILLINHLKSLSGKTIVSASHNAIWMEHADQIINL